MVEESGYVGCRLVTSVFWWEPTFFDLVWGRRGVGHHEVLTTMELVLAIFAMLCK